MTAKLLIGSAMVLLGMLMLPSRYGTLSEPRHPLVPKPRLTCGQEVPASCPSNINH